MAPFSRRGKTARNLALAEAALALARDRNPAKRSKRSRGKLLLAGGAVVAAGAAALLKRDKVAGLLPSRSGDDAPPAPVPVPSQPSNYDAPGPVANTATPVPAPDPQPDPSGAHEPIDEAAEEAAAAAEAAHIGGDPVEYAGEDLRRAGRRGVPPAGRGRRGRVGGRGAGRGRPRGERDVPRRGAERRGGADRGGHRGGRPAVRGRDPGGRDPGRRHAVRGRGGPRGGGDAGRASPSPRRRPEPEAAEPEPTAAEPEPEPRREPEPRARAAEPAAAEPEPETRQETFLPPTPAAPESDLAPDPASESGRRRRPGRLAHVVRARREPVTGV